MSTPDNTPATIQQPPPAPALVAPSNPFQRGHNETIAAGAVAIESERAIAEAQGRLVIAQRFPRDEYKAMERALNACKRPDLAKTAFYSYKRGGQTVSGPSIRLAEELARCWGNIEYGLRELSNREGVSEMEAYAWDMETNVPTKQQFTVRHLRDRSESNGGAKELTDQRDIYEITANMGARRMRARILAVLPDDYVNAAVQQCRKTLETRDGGVSMPERIKRTLNTLSTIGITAQHVENYLGHALDETVPDELADLFGIFTSIKDGQSKVSDWFGARVTPPIAIPATAATTTAAAPTTDAATTAPNAPAPEAKRRAPRQRADATTQPETAKPAETSAPVAAAAAAATTTAIAASGDIF